MQDNEIYEEANLLVKRSKLKAKERVNIEKEYLTSSEEKLDILVSTIEEMMQNITMRDEFVVQKHHVPLIVEEEEVVDPNPFPANPISKKYCFMYSFMDSHENGFTDQLVEKQFADPMCMLEDITYIDDLPKY